MGRLINGKWVKTSIVTSDESGKYDRLKRTFLDEISKDGEFKPEKGRYHLYVSLACPWAHRTLIYREFKQLQNIISVSVVHPDMLDFGWYFDDSFPGATKDHVNNNDYLFQNYQLAQSNVTTSVTVPILWDKKKHKIVNNESSHIIRFFNDQFNDLTNNGLDLYPLNLQDEINHFNEITYESINNGVYKCGFAKNQNSYDLAVTTLFNALDRLDVHLKDRNYLVGDQLTEADIRLIPTLLRFDAVYFTHFKCNIKRIKDYSNLFRYMKNLYELEEIRKTTNFDHIKRHYFFSHEMINPYRIIPKGPSDFI